VLAASLIAVGLDVSPALAASAPPSNDREPAPAIDIVSRIRTVILRIRFIPPQTLLRLAPTRERETRPWSKISSSTDVSQLSHCLDVLCATLV
jgi:hypothetical protein